MKNILKNVLCLFLATTVLYSCSKKDIGTGGPDVGGVEEPTGLILPQKELRAVWIATVWNIDWPRTANFSGPLYEAEGQKASYRAMLDHYVSLGFNTVFVQVRSQGDAFYESPYEPWSAFLTNTRGKNPGYDVLGFLVEEAHARGLEFHAWINPFRITTRTAATASFPALHPSIDPEWIVEHEKLQMYNPAIAGARQRLADVAKDIITKYDVDGLHMDDYFYPDPTSVGALTSDQELYEQLGSGFATIEDWRRDNVDKTIELMYETVVANRPEIVFSVSPAPNRDYNRNVLYADVVKWCKEGWVDLLIPQLYQEIGNVSNDFHFNLAIWSQYAYKAKLAVGYAMYKFGNSAEITATSPFHSTQELVRQFNMVDKYRKVEGSVMYNATAVYSNRIGITDQLAELYNHKAIMPFMGREIVAPTETPINLAVAGNKLSWSAVAGDDVRYAIYHFTDLKKKGKLVDVVTSTELPVEEVGYYSVTSLNADNLESDPSDTVEKK